MIFASLTPSDLRTSHSMQRVLDTISSRGEGSEHHKKFVKYQAGDFVATRSPIVSPSSFDSSSGNTTEADRSSDEEVSPDTSACYILSVTISPRNEQGRYWFGTGDLARYPDTAGVDLLLPPTLEDHQSLVYARQGYFAFNPRYGQLFLHAHHRGIRINDHPLAPKAKIMLGERSRISVGPYRYIFEFKISDEQRFQRLKSEFLSTFHNMTPLESTSVTPSANDVRIQGWRLHGVVGATPVNTIHAATNVSSGEVVAVKRLRFGTSSQTAEKENRLYDEILSSTSSHRYSSFLMHKHAIIVDQRPPNSVHEAYLLWKPLARGDFTRFGLLGEWREDSVTLKKTLFVQILLGLSALHDRGWIHRDLKPANLGVVERGDRPLAIIMDEAQAIRQNPRGHSPRIGHCGTIGFLAPEMESNLYALAYDEKVDVWSMGAVAYFLFEQGRIPWSVTSNMFVPNADPTLSVFHEVRERLLSHPAETLQHLIGQMLDVDPRRRPAVSRILAHPAIDAVREVIESDLEARKSAGQKRARVS